MNWSRNHERCTSCKTTLFKHKGNGLCAKCYPIDREIKKMKSLNEKKLDIYIIKNIFIPDIPKLKSKDVRTQKEIIQKEIEFKKLRYLRQYGCIESGDIVVNIVLLENILNEIRGRIIKNNDNL